MERTARIPVFEETKKRLIVEKRDMRKRLNKKLTWDEFLLMKRGC